jgi:dTDP-glucose 4,6-dehydratase
MPAHTILVTGGAGFIGSNFVHYLLRTTDDINAIVFDKLTYAGNLENLADILHDPRVSFEQGDICDAQVVQKVMQRCDWVINFAAETHVDRSITNPNAFIITDVEGTFTLLEAARQIGVERFIQISTDEVYGNAEDAHGVSRPSLETDALNPLSPYAASKAGADRLAFSYWATYGLPVIITRCSNNYGPHQYLEKQVPLFITNALAHRALPVYGDGRNTRDWIYVDDHCATLLALLLAPIDQLAGEVFNIGTGEEHSVLENARAILDILHRPHDLITFVTDRPGHVRRHAVNTQKLRTRLAWKPAISFVEGLARTVDWYRTHPDWVQNVLERRDTFLAHALTLGS